MEDLEAVQEGGEGRMQDKAVTTRARIIIVGVEESRRQMGEIREAADRTKASVERLNISLRQLNEAMEEFAELRKKLF